MAAKTKAASAAQPVPMDSNTRQQKIVTPTSIRRSRDQDHEQGGLLLRVPTKRSY